MDTRKKLVRASAQKIADSWAFMKVSEGTRTPDRLDHNQELYQLSYAHRENVESTIAGHSPDGFGRAMGIGAGLGLGLALGEDLMDNVFWLRTVSGTCPRSSAG